MTIVYCNLLDTINSKDLTAVMNRNYSDKKKGEGRKMKMNLINKIKVLWFGSVVV